jgi:hypothetical protein
MRLKSIIIACLLLIPSLAFAATEYRLLQGDCSNGNRWWAVSEYQNGRLMAIHGLDCKGNEYHKQGYRIVASDPTGGAPATFTGTGDNGATWYAVVRVENGLVVWQGGQDADGAYWVWDASVDDTPDPGEDLN